MTVSGLMISAMLAFLAGLIPRITRWSEAAYDIRAVRSKVKDGPFSVAMESRSLAGSEPSGCGGQE